MGVVGVLPLRLPQPSSGPPSPPDVLEMASGFSKATGTSVIPRVLDPEAS